MTTDLDHLLREHEEAILDRWEARLVRSELGVRTGTPEMRRSRHKEALRGALAALEQKGGAAALPFAIGMARIELRRPGVERNQADAVLSLLLGREAMRDVLSSKVDVADWPGLQRDLDAAFNQVISLYGQTTCTMCQARQEENRVKVERHLESVLESSQDAIVLCNLDCRIDHWNAGAEEMFGWTAEEMRGASLERVHPGGRWAEGAREELLAGLLADGHVRSPELSLTRRDGSALWVDASYTLVRDATDRPLGVWVLFRDVTEQRRVLDDRLHAERLALVGVMSARFAHEIRNPLTSILINLDLLRDSMRARETGVDDEETVGAIASEVNRIQNVVHDYLRFGRKPQLSRGPVALDDLLRSHLSMLAPELGQREVALVLDLGADGAIVDADGDQLWQAILNLVRNGMEAMPGGGQLTISTRREGDRVACTVSDTGVGMPPEVQAEMFRPFYSTKRGGTGLGMPFVRQVVTEHGATLACRSEPGLGTTFTIALPLVVSEDEPASNGIEGGEDRD
jgi:PAS domain S-box-containing protein